MSNANFAVHYVDEMQFCCVPSTRFALMFPILCKYNNAIDVTNVLCV